MRGLSATGLTHSYGHVEILRGVDLSVEPGQSIAITGPSGSGKSTLLAVLGLLMPPDQGSVLIDGMPVAAGQKRSTTLFAWVFQSANALLHRSVEDNVILGARCAGVDEGEAVARAMVALERMGLLQLRTARTSTLSGGELQRVSIARAIAAKSRFLLADEPTGQLDAHTSDRVAVHLLDQIQDRVTIIATHDLELARKCDRHYVLERGRLRELYQ